MATIGERIIETFGGMTAKRMQEVIREVSVRAYESGYSDGNDDPASGGIAGGGFGYRKASQGLRDFSKASPSQILETVWTLWQSSPIAKRAITLKRDHVVGKGAKFETDDPDLQKILDDFYANNGLKARVPEFGLQLRLLGEQVYPAFVRKTDGRVTMGYIDPGTVEKVITHPENSMERWMVVCKAPGGQDKKVYRIIREDKEYVVEVGGEPKVQDPTHPGKLVTHNQTEIQPWETAALNEMGVPNYGGSVFFFPINCLSNGTRGYSDLVQVADWIDQAEETLFAVADREQMAGYFYTSIGVDGDDEQVKKRANYYRRNVPKKGGFLVHNKSEEPKVQYPDIGQAGSIQTFVALLTFIMGGLGFPVAFYGYGDDTNRSTLQEQATPSEKTLEHDQYQFEQMMLFIARFVKDQAEIAEMPIWKPDDDVNSEIRFPLPAIRSEDIAGIVQAFTPLMAGLVQAEDNRYIGQKTAARIAHKILNELGADIDTTKELETVDGEEETAVQDDNDKLDGMLKNSSKNGDSRESVTYVINNSA